MYIKIPKHTEKFIALIIICHASKLFIQPVVRMVRLKILPNPLTNKPIFSNLSIITIFSPHVHQTLLVSF